MVDAASPIVYGYGDNLAIFASNPPVFNLSNMAGGGGGGGAAGRRTYNARRAAARPTIRIFRRAALRWRFPKSRMPNGWEAQPLTDEQLRNPVNVIPPAARPRVVLR